MATFTVIDAAHQYRIEIIGNFAGPSARDVETSWRHALDAKLQRPIVVDITRIEGYDRIGIALLRKMHKHGTVIAASSAFSLTLLEEITAMRHRPALLREAPVPEAPAKSKRQSKNSRPPEQTWVAAGGK